VLGVAPRKVLDGQSPHSLRAKRLGGAVGPQTPPEFNVSSSIEPEDDFTCDGHPLGEGVQWESAVERPDHFPKPLVVFKPQCVEEV
jgi:hypothetical protein